VAGGGALFVFTKSPLQKRKLIWRKTRHGASTTNFGFFFLHNAHMFLAHSLRMSSRCVMIERTNNIERTNTKWIITVTQGEKILMKFTHTVKRCFAVSLWWAQCEIQATFISKITKHKT
jgi:hypothetical protein